jgi:hypothetical protein
MNKAMKCIFLAVAMVFTAPLLFGIAYLLWPKYIFTAIAVLFVGFAMDLVGGLKILDYTLSHA